MSAFTLPHPSYATPQMSNPYNSLVSDLLDNNLRENALAELSKQREQLPDLAVALWNRFGVVTVLIHEIISTYPLLVPSGLNSATSTRVCNALALLQCIASHESTRSAFLQAHIPLYLYPFLNTTSKTRPFEYLRLTSLGVIGALVKSDNSDVIDFLLSTEIIPLCLRIMETGNELSRTVAIFIVQKILLDNVGLGYVCQTYERFHAVVSVLNSMVLQLHEQKSLRLLKHIIRCYLRLTDNKKALEGLKQILPNSLRDGTFKSLMAEDANTIKFYEDLMNRLS